jgi:hypothetical protein
MEAVCFKICRDPVQYRRVRDLESSRLGRRQTGTEGVSLIRSLREKHGRDFENWWRQTFGFGYDSLIRSEARRPENSSNAHAVRDRLVAAGLESRAFPSDAASEPLIKSEP